MFEDATFESSGRIRTRSRAWCVAAFALNTSILGALIVIPLVYPEALPRHLMNMLLVAPPPPTPPKPVDVKPTQAVRGRPEMSPIGLNVPTQIPTTIRMIDRPEGPTGPLITMDSEPAIPGGNPFGHGGTPPPRVVRELPRGPQRISSGVAEGMLLQRITPQYPPIARAMGAQGTVVLVASISRNGTIENLHVVSGPQVLQQAAIDAVSRWRYRPFLLNGQPGEVQTTVSVVFSMGR